MARNGGPRMNRLKRHIPVSTTPHGDTRRATNRQKIVKRSREDVELVIKSKLAALTSGQLLDEIPDEMVDQVLEAVCAETSAMNFGCAITTQ